MHIWIPGSVHNALMASPMVMLMASFSSNPLIISNWSRHFIWPAQTIRKEVRFKMGEWMRGKTQNLFLLILLSMQQFVIFIIDCHLFMTIKNYLHLTQSNFFSPTKLKTTACSAKTLIACKTLLYTPKGNERKRWEIK